MEKPACVCSCVPRVRSVRGQEKERAFPGRTPYMGGERQQVSANTPYMGGKFGRATVSTPKMGGKGKEFQLA